MRNNDKTFCDRCGAENPDCEYGEMRLNLRKPVTNFGLHSEAGLASHTVEGYDELTAECDLCLECGLELLKWLENKK